MQNGLSGCCEHRGGWQTGAQKRAWWAPGGPQHTAAAPHSAGLSVCLSHLSAQAPCVFFMAVSNVLFPGVTRECSAGSL